jgi:hypothetical protein
MKLIPLDKHGWPVERFRNRPIANAIRLLLHTRKVVTEREWKRREAAIHSVLSSVGFRAASPLSEPRFLADMFGSVICFPSAKPRERRPE